MDNDEPMIQSALTDVRFLHWFDLEFPPNWVSQRHRHRENELILVASGRMAARLENSVLTGQAGSVLVFPRRFWHTSSTLGADRLHILVLRWSGADELFRPVTPGVYTDQRGYIEQQLAWALDLHPTHDQRDQTMLHLLAYTIVHELRRLTQSPAQDLATRIRRYIRANMGRRIYLDELAQEAGMSKYHFSRIFKQVTGQTPIQMVNQLRIEAATQRLLFSDDTLDKIAHELGFVDASHLCHMFRRLTGGTPGALRSERSL